MKIMNLIPLFLIVFIPVSISPLFAQNYAFQFDGVDDLVEIPDDQSLDITNELTIELWFNWMPNGNEWQTIVSKGPSDVENYALFMHEADRFIHFVLNSENGRVGINSAYNIIIPGHWHYIVATYDGNTAKIYIDGTLVTEYFMNGVLLSNNSTLRIGHREGESFYWNGIIDEVRIWNIVFTSSEIQANMCRKVTESEPGLVGYWSFNEGVGDTAFDYSGNGNHGVIYGASWVPSSAPTGLTFFFTNPNFAYQNHPLITSIHGTNTHFADSSGTSNVWLARGDTATIIAHNFTVHSNTSLDAVIVIPADVPAGFWDIKIETAIDSVITMNNGMEIISPPKFFSQTSSTSSWLKGITAADELHAWAVGILGTIVTTTNGGENWTLQNSGTPNTLNAVCFTDLNTGWAVGQSGIILHSGNSGIDWTPQSSGTLNNLQSLSFTDTVTGWAVGSNGTILHTSDGGENWIPQNSGSSSWLYAVCFTDAAHGWAAGGTGSLLHTSDGGVNWTIQNSGSSEYLFSIQFVDSSNGWVAGSGGTILHTNDGGSSWTSQSSGTDSWLRSVHFWGADTGFVVGNGGTFLMTTDGGTSWESRRSTTGSTLNSLCFADHTTGWVAGESGTIMKMTFREILNSLEEGTIVQLIPDQFELLPNYPNPFNPSTTITYRLPYRSEVILRVYNLLGQEIRTLVNGIQTGGEYQVVWDGKDQYNRTVSSGIYIYTLQAEKYFSSRKMLFLK